MSINKNSLIISIDDELHNLDIIEYLFKDKYQIKSFSKPFEALEFVNSSKPDLVLLDIMMPEIDGYEVCKKLKAHPNCLHTKIILISGKNLLEERLKGYSSGANDYLKKPFEHEVLEAKVKVFVELAQTERELYRLNSNLELEVQERTKEILELEKVASIGINTAEIVHNIKNPLLIMKMNLKFLKSKIKSSPYIEKIENALNKINSIVETTLNRDDRFGHQITNLDLNDIIEKELTFCSDQKITDEQIIIKKSLDPLPSIRGEAIHFSQVFGNIINNAVESLSRTKEPEIEICSKLENEEIIITISDNGPGIPKEVGDKIFDPFFTTKNEKDEKDEKGIIGTGLGLSYCRKMIRAYGGNISISEKSNGASFLITLKVK